MCYVQYILKWSQWRSYIGTFRAHALPNSLSALPLSAIILAESGKRLMVNLVYMSVPYWCLPHV